MQKINWLDHLVNFLSVIIGVSLAFVISNKSEQFKLDREFKLNVEAILEEVNSDIRNFETYQIPDNREKLERQNQALRLVSENTGGDSLTQYLQVFFDINNYSPTNTTINSLITSGKLDLINDFELKKMILSYQIFAQELEAQGDFQVEYFMDRIIPWFIKNPSFLIEEQKSKQKDGRDNTDLVFILTFYNSFLASKVGKYEEALIQAKALRDKLEMYVPKAEN
ncbi:MAG: hypothetical protein AAF616_04925 [Bacteroidota bacterium]